MEESGRHEGGTKGSPTKISKRSIKEESSSGSEILIPNPDNLLTGSAQSTFILADPATHARKSQIKAILENRQNEVSEKT